MSQPDTPDDLVVEQQTLLDLQVLHPVDPPASPQIVSAEVAADGVTFTLTFDTALSPYPVAVDVSSLQTLTADAVDAPIDSGGTLAGTTLEMTLTDPVFVDQVLLTSYSGSYLTSAYYSTWGLLETYTDFPVTNNSTQLDEFAGSWQFLGSTSISGPTVQCSLARMTDTRVAVCIRLETGANDTSDVAAYDWNGTGFVKVGSSYQLTFTGTAPGVSAIDATRVAYTRATSADVRILTHNGTVFSNTGTPLSLSGTGTHAETLMGALTVRAEATSGQMRAYSNDGSTFADVGGSSVISSGGMSVTALSSTVVVTYQAPPQTMQAYTWSGSAFATLGSAFTWPGGTAYGAIAGVNETQVAIVDGSTDTIRLVTLSAGTWSLTGTPLAVTGGLPTTNGTIAIAHLGGGYVVVLDSTSDLLRMYRVT